MSAGSLIALGVVVAVLFVAVVIDAVRDEIRDQRARDDEHRNRLRIAQARARAREEVIEEQGRCAVFEAERITREGASS